jgi:aldehyde:ferredoxin oxidoreductase
MYKSSFFPVGYFEDVDWEEMNDKYGGPAYLEKHQKKNVGCFACPIRCKNFLHVPEFGKGFTTCEPWSGFTGAVWNTDMDVFWQGTQAANRLGLDATETSASIGLLMELHHEQLISEKDTDGSPWSAGPRRPSSRRSARSPSGRASERSSPMASAPSPKRSGRRPWRSSTS